MSMYALTERSSLPDSWHQRGMQWASHHSLQANFMYKFFIFRSLLAKFVEFMSCPYFVPTLYKELFCSFFMHACILYLSHIQHYY